MSDEGAYYREQSRLEVENETACTNEERDRAEAEGEYCREQYGD
jgi:hypothetical protein